MVNNKTKILSGGSCMLKELMEEVITLQDKERFLDKLLSQCISLISAYLGKDKLKAKIYIDRIDDLIREYNLCFINKEAE
jgi:hypothetical protein